MSGNLLMMGILKSMLLEAELKDTLRTISFDDKIIIKLNGDKTHIYSVFYHTDNEIIMRDDAVIKTDEFYILTSDSLDGQNLTIYKYDDKAKANDFKGTEFKMSIDSMYVNNNKTGTNTEIDFEKTKVDDDSLDDDSLDGGDSLDDRRDNDEELQNRISGYDKILKELNEGDILRLTTDSLSNEEGEDTIVNDLFFKVSNITTDWYIFTLDSVSGNVDSITAKSIGKLTNNINKKEFYIAKEQFFKIIKNSVSIILHFGNKQDSVINDIIGVDVNNINNNDDFDATDKKYSEKELMQWLYDTKNKNYMDLINKTPTFWEKVRGASPKGLYHLKRMLQQRGVDNSYLTKGDFVNIKLLSTNLVSDDLSRKLVNKRGAYYNTKVVGDNLLQQGKIGQGHWELKLLEDLDDSTYKTEVSFCKKDKTCKIMSKNALIKIINNE